MAVALAAWLAALPAGTVCVTVGNPQTGKSYAMKAADRAGAFPRRVTFDHLAHRDRLLYSRGLKDTPPWGGTWCEPRELVKHAKPILCARTVQVVVAPKRVHARTLGAQFDLVAGAVYAVGGVDLIAEEAGEYTRHAADQLHTIASSGGHALMRAFLICQRFGRLHIDARECVNAVVGFSQSSPDDLQALRGRCGDEFAAAVRSLRPGDAPILWRLGRGVERAERT